jgi:hypothetical protein
MIVNADATRPRELVKVTSTATRLTTLTTGGNGN